MARQAPLLGRAFAVNPRSPQGRAGRREGLTAKARAELQWCPGHYAANVTAFLLIPLFPVEVPMTFVQLIQGGALFAMRRCSHINLYPVGIESRTKVPHASLRGHRAPRGMGPIYYAAYCSHAQNRSHIHLGNGTFFLSSLRCFYLLLRTAPSGTTPVSR